MIKELVIGSGNCTEKKIFNPNVGNAYVNPTYLDIDERASPDVLWDLNIRPLPFENEEFDEIHAYEVLEHVGRQGDWKGFFEEFSEYSRILKVGGRMYCTCPSIKSPWLWGDPGHTRVINDCTIVFLSQAEYEKQVGKTAMTDYRSIYTGNLEPIHTEDDGENFFFVLEKH